MLRHKHTDRICCIIVAVALIVGVLFMCASSLGVVSTASAMGYETRLFDTSRVHTIDIVMDDWDGFIETCANEEYSACSIVIDGEAYKNVAIRAKGNTSLSSVAAYGNDRYSFKVEFDKYTDANSYYGLDKLSLNNIIQDNTYLKDYLSYTMMRAAGAVSPLCSFAYITVNGEDWGLYLAVEGVEEGFLQRNYGTDYGSLYKPDSMGFGGGRGNGKQFDMKEFINENGVDNAQDGNASETTPTGGISFDPAATGEIQPPDGPAPPDNAAVQQPETGIESRDPAPSAGDSQSTSGTPPEAGQTAGEGSAAAQNAPAFPGGDNARNMDGGPAGGMGSSDVMLQYLDDDPDSYQNIFDNAKTDITKADKSRLISSLKTLSEAGDPASVVDVDAVIKYFVAHTFVRNDDSYTGSMIHNYYLYEEDGVLSMIPWDYNLAFGGFGMGGGRGGQSSSSAAGATSDINYPIDSPVSGDISTRPMISWIFNSEEYTALYHQYYRDFIESYFDSGVFEETYDRVVELISPYVEKDPTAFCTYEEFQTGVQTLREFCLLRAQSISGQLDGSIPSTSEGQSADSSTLIDASHLSVSDMGSMRAGGGQGESGKMGNRDIEVLSPTAPQDADTAAQTQDIAAAQQQTDAGTAGSIPSGGADATPQNGQSGNSGTPPDTSGTAGSRSGRNPGILGSDDAVPPDTQTSDAGSSIESASPSPGSTADTGQSGNTNPVQQNNGGRQGNMPGIPGGQVPGAESGSPAAEHLIWLGVSVLVLAAGLFIAWKTKH